MEKTNRPNQVIAKLLYCSPISLLSTAVRTCTDSEDKLDTGIDDFEFGLADEKLVTEKILRKGKKYNPLFPTHESTLEHVVYTFELIFSRGVLQELSRHRIASPSVQSSRWALKKMVKKMTMDNLHKHLTRTGDKEVDDQNIRQLMFLIEQVKKGKPNDTTKYLISDAFRTKEILTINARSLRNLFRLRTSKHALWEIRQLAFAMVDVIPDGHMVLFEDRIHDRPSYC